MNNNFKPLEEIRDLKLLEELEKNPFVSQRELSHKFNIALGVTNACIRRMIRRGLVKIRSLNHKKIGYFLTPKGFSEKTKLTFQLISYTIHHYADLKKIINQRFLEMQKVGVKRVVFYGVSDEMEVAYITIQGTNLKLVGIVEDDEKFKPTIIFGYELEPVSRVQELRPDCIFITSLFKIEEKKKKLKKIIDSNFIYLKDIYV